MIYNYTWLQNFIDPLGGKFTGWLGVYKDIKKNVLHL